MKHTYQLLSLCGLLVLCPGGSAAGESQSKLAASRLHSTLQAAPLSAEEILRRATDARGGGAMAARIRSYDCKGTVDFAWGGRCDYECLATRSNQVRAIYDFGGGGRYDFAFDGQVAWEGKPGGAPELQSGEKLREAQDAAAFFADYDDPAAFRSVTYVGEASFDGIPCHELKLVTQSGLEQAHFYNATNYLLAGMSHRTTGDAGPDWVRMSFLEYRKFGGFRFPTRYRCRTEDNEWVIRINSVRVNCTAGSAFNRPTGLAAAPAESAPPAPPATLTDAEIKTILQDRVEGDKVSVGLVVGLLDAQGSRVISCGKLDNGSSPEVNGDTLFEIGSITKVFTRLLLHDLVARGEMTLDDPVQKYLPASVRMPTRRGKQITLWDLTTHTSGLPREMGDPWTVEHLYAFLGHYKLRRDPGDQFEYSNIGVALLGHVIALKAGQDYETLVRERICRPLKMDSTVITLTPELQVRRATGHTSVNRPAGYIGMQDIPGCGALFSTANDMLKFASARLGLTPSPLSPLMKKTLVGHNGGTFGFSTELAFDLKQHHALVVLANCRNDDVVTQLTALLKEQSPKPPDTVVLSAEPGDPFVGQYYAGEGRIRSVRREVGRWLLQEWGQGSCELFPLSQTNFYNQLFGCRASFLSDNNTGRARDLVVGGWHGVRLSGQILPPSASPLTDHDCQPRPDSDLQGVWQAKLRLWYWPFASSRLNVRIAELSPGAFRAEGDSPDQGVQGEPLGIVYSRPNVQVFLLAQDGSFQGKLNPARTKVTGHWKQAGYNIHVTFRRVQPLPVPRAEVSPEPRRSTLDPDRGYYGEAPARLRWGYGRERAIGDATPPIPPNRRTTVRAAGNSVHCTRGSPPRGCYALKAGGWSDRTGAKSQTPEYPGS
jgi:CubicO group peptidase (beta-lactamase class C family)